MKRMNAEFAGLALLAATLTMAGTLASTGAPLYANPLQTEVGHTAPTPPGVDVLKVRYRLS